MRPGPCGYIDGFNIDLTGINLGDFPNNWNTTLGGFYESCFTVPNQFSGDGNWSVTIQNGWTGSGGGVNFDGTITLFYACNLEPEEPDTSQFMAADTVMIEFTFESQTADFVILDMDGNPLDVLCSGDDPASFPPRRRGVWTADCVGCLNTPEKSIRRKLRRAFWR